MEMPWTEARDFASACARIARDKLLNASIAARASQADEKGWKAWLKELER